MTDCSCNTDDKKNTDCACENCLGSECGCKKDTDASYGTGDNQQVTFSAEDISKMNALFGDMDLTSGEDVDQTLDLTQDDVERLSKKFGNNG